MGVFQRAEQYISATNMADIGDKREKLHIYEFTSALRYFRKNKSDVLKSARDASRYFTWILFLHFKSRIYEWLHF